MDALEAVELQMAYEEGGLDAANDVIKEIVDRGGDLLFPDTTDIPDDYNLPTPSVSSDTGKGDIIAAVVSIALVGGILFFTIRAAMKEDKRLREAAERSKRKAEEEREKAQSAASRGATVLQNTDGTYWIVENERSLAMLKAFSENGDATVADNITHGEFTSTDS